jgi:surface carbohydrate biosynthesis protein
MRMGIILGFYGSKRRDAFTLILLKYLLERSYHREMLLHRIDTDEYVLRRIKYYRPQAVLILDAKFPSQVTIINEACRFRYRVILMPSELQTSHVAGRNVYMKQKARIAKIDTYLAPSPSTKTFLVREGILPDQRVPLVGYPRFDSYAPPFPDYLQLNREAFFARHRLTERLPIILWASNNRFYTIQQATDKAEARAAAVRRFKANNVDEVHDLDTWIDAFIESHDYSLGALERLLDRFGDKVQLLYRPRQGEDVAVYGPFVSRFRNVRLVHDEYLGNLLAHSDLVFHGFSVLGSEAWIFQKPTVSYCFCGLDQYYFDAFQGCEDVVKTEAGLFDVIDRFLAGTYSAEGYRAMQQRFLETWYYKIDGLATARAAKAIDRALDDDGGLSQAGELDAPALPLIDRMTFRAKRVLGLEDFSSLNPLHLSRRRMALDAWITKTDISAWFKLFDQMFERGDVRQRLERVEMVA